MKKGLLLLLPCLVAAGLHAQEKPNLKVGGRLCLATYYDTYKSVDSRDGVSYSFPMAPRIEERGYDIHQVGQFAMTPHETRINLEATGFKVLDAQARMYIETDFLGSKSDYFQMLRLRHAYLDLHWERDELLLGQTNNLLMVDETCAGVLTFGAGSPITVLERPAMIRYGRKLGEHGKFYAALSYRQSKTGDPQDAETKNASRNNGFPGVEMRIQSGDPNRFLFGIGGGYRSQRPRIATEHGMKTNTRIGSYSATAFFHWKTDDGATLKLQGVYGTDLSHLGMIGGYGVLYDARGKEDFTYTNFITASGWIDWESKSYDGYRLGVFGGYMHNLGTEEAVYQSEVFAWNPEVNMTGRVSPRCTFTRNNFLIGLEYSFFFARWGKTFDSHFRPVESYDITMNHRILLLTRFTF